MLQNSRPLTRTNWALFDKPTGRSVMEFSCPAAATVLRLFFICRPSAISGLVSPVVVDSIKRHPLGPVAHVGQKSLARAPRRANRNSAPAVIWEPRIGWVLTTLNHCLPTFCRLGLPELIVGCAHVSALHLWYNRMNRDGLSAFRSEPTRVRFSTPQSQRTVTKRSPQRNTFRAVGSGGGQDTRNLRVFHISHCSRQNPYIRTPVCR